MQPTSFDKPLFGKYELRGKLKTGGFGSVYRAKPITKSDANQYAVKVLPNKHERYAQIQYNLYQAIAKAHFTSGFVKHYEYGKFDGKICLVMELVGHDLDDLKQKTKSNHFSVKTGLMIGLQAIDRIEALHTIGYLHRDIKPDNFTIGLNQKSALVYLIDFGLSKKIQAPMPKEQKNKVIGTLAYMSCHVHEGKQPGILDDIESFIYTIVYLIHGTLPWMHINVQQPADYHRIKIMKQKLSRSWFIKHNIPEQLYDLLQNCKSAKRNPKFDYLQVKYKLMNALASINAENDFNFDWLKSNQAKLSKRETSRKKIEEEMHLNQMNEDNQKIVQNQIYEIYKFMDEEQRKERKDKKPSPKKIKEHPLIEKAELQRKKEARKNELKAQQMQKQQAAQKQKRPMSSNNPRPGSRQKSQAQNQLQKQLKLFDSMKFEGPKIVINRTAAHKI